MSLIDCSDVLRAQSDNASVRLGRTICLQRRAESAQQNKQTKSDFSHAEPATRKRAVSEGRSLTVRSVASVRCSSCAAKGSVMCFGSDLSCREF